MRRFILTAMWNALTFVAAIHAGVLVSYSRLCGEWLEPADELDDVERVDLAKTRAR